MKYVAIHSRNEIAVCPDDCSGHGRCISMAKLAATATALPLTADTTYEGAESTTTWDEERMFGCVCDSSWSVGLASGETQVPEFFGSNCEQRWSSCIYCLM